MNVSVKCTEQDYSFKSETWLVKVILESANNIDTLISVLLPDSIQCEMGIIMKY